MKLSPPLILAGGLGTRLKKIIPDKPKVMAEINKRPFLEYLFDNLIKQGFKSVILLLGYKSDYIKNYFSNTYKSK